MNGRTAAIYSLAKDGTKALSKNFRVREFRSKDGADPIIIDPALVTVLQQLRDRVGRPVVITSGYRTPSHNRSVGGAAYSQHLYGTAADIQVSGVTPKTLAKHAEAILPDTGGIGIYTWGIHVDTRPTKARWNG